MNRHDGYTCVHAVIVPHTQVCLGRNTDCGSVHRAQQPGVHPFSCCRAQFDGIRTNGQTSSAHGERYRRPGVIPGVVRVWSSSFLFVLHSASSPEHVCMCLFRPQSRLQSRRILWTHLGLSAWWCCCPPASGRALHAWSPGRSYLRPVWFSRRTREEVSGWITEGYQFWWISAFGPVMTCSVSTFRPVRLQC